MLLDFPKPLTRVYSLSYYSNKAAELYSVSLIKPLPPYNQGMQLATTWLSWLGMQPVVMKLSKA